MRPVGSARERSPPVFILTEHTPNPAAMKFVPHVPLTSGAAFAFARAGFDGRRSPLAELLFAITEVAAVYIAPAFVTVTLSPGARWTALRIPALGAIADHLATGAPAVALDPIEDVAASLPSTAASDDIEAEIQSILSRWIRPGVVRDGGDILLDRFDAETGVLWIRMRGACGGCPSARLTLKAGVERIVRRHVPEVLSVEEVAEAGSAAASGAKTWLANLAARAGPPRRPIFTHEGHEMSRDPQTEIVVPPRP
jgi:Fe-S cluster biogenesis protein NfuA